MKKFFFSVLLILTLFHTGFAKSTGFTQEDRERLIRLEATLQTFMEQTNKRFEDMNKRFEDMNKRFEELREDMNKRFEQMMKFMELMLLIFTSLVVAVIGFAYWDRRTIIRKAKEESVEEVGRRFSLEQIKKLIEVLRELAREDEKVARVLRQFGLF